MALIQTIIFRFLKTAHMVQIKSNKLEGLNDAVKVNNIKLAAENKIANVWYHW